MPPAAPPPLGLSAVPSELRTLTPYLQRADELKSKEPVVAYWCTYYAAQLGIGLKSKDAGARTFLFEVLGLLEGMKKAIGASDIIENEAVSSAYVENFALKVFVSADNEDRGGDPTRLTAKKFLAAANFLEVLKVFDPANISDSHEDKIRYAKWKAADIARAFREGRKPVPGPAGGVEAYAPIPPTLSPSVAPSALPTTPPPASPSATSPHAHPRPSPQMHPDAIARANEGHLSPSAHTHKHDAAHTPGAWSTMATPGTVTPGAPFGVFGAPDAQGHVDHGLEPPGRAESSASIRDGDTSATDLPHGSANREVLGIDDERDAGDEHSFSHGHDPARGVHFSPSVTGGLTPGSELPPVVFRVVDSDAAHPHTDAPVIVSPMPFRPGPGPPAVPGPPSPGTVRSDDDYDAAVATRTPTVTRTPTSAHASLPPGFVPNRDQAVTPVHGGGLGLSPGGYAPPSNAGIPPPPIIQSFRPTAPPAPPPSFVPSAPPASPPVPALTPALIAKTQRHCRFAISALDYEDAAEARKQLRLALAMLGA